MKRISIIAIAVLLLACAVQAQGHRPPGPPSGAPGGPAVGPGSNDNGLAEYLGLTADQKAAWQTNQQELRTAAQALHEQQRALHDALQTALESGDATAVGTIMLQIRAIGDQLKAARDAAEAKFEALLTSEQISKYEAFQAALDFLRQRGPGGPSGRP